MTFCSGRSFIAASRVGLSTEPLTTVASPSEAQNRYTFSLIKPVLAEEVLYFWLSSAFPSFEKSDT
jgi:hypothetical protein